MSLCRRVVAFLVFSVHAVDGHFDGFRMGLLQTEEGPCNVRVM